MSNKEILEKAIQKAIAQGFEWPWNKDYLYFNFSGDDDDLSLWNGGEYEDATLLHHMEVIFNHDFAKALWGLPTYAVGEHHFQTKSGLTQWQHHLQQMVIAEDPIKYLGENL